MGCTGKLRNEMDEGCANGGWRSGETLAFIIYVFNGICYKLALYEWDFFCDCVSKIFS